MSTIFINLSSITENTNVYGEEISFKGAPTINFVLTGISEAINSALTLDINWGDSSSINMLKKILSSIIKLNLFLMKFYMVRLVELF